MALDDVLDVLACPRCGAGLRREFGALACPAGHSFDVARQGHVNLLGGPQPANADTPEMVAARLAFLASGHYAPVADAVAAALGDATTIVDVGAGPGWYLARWLGEGRRGVAVDVSAAACRRAARAHPRIGAVVADVWRALPLRDGSADAVTCVFAPRNPAEMARVLAPGGRLVVAAPGPDHLREARAALGLLDVGADKQARLADSLAGEFDAAGSWPVRATMRLSAAELAAVVDMGPNAFHAHAAPVGGMDVTLGVVVSAYARR